MDRQAKTIRITYNGEDAYIPLKRLQVYAEEFNVILTDNYELFSLNDDVIECVLEEADV